MNVTAGSVLIGLLMLGGRLTFWYRKHGRKTGAAKGGEGGGKRKITPLGPFLWAMLYGTLSALATGGLMGEAAHGVEQSGNTLGDKMLSSLAGASSPSVLRQGIAMLNPGGAVLLIVVMLGCLIWFLFHGWRIKIEMFCGYVAGVTLGPTAGLAGIAGVVVAPIFNAGGNWIVLHGGFHG